MNRLLAALAWSGRDTMLSLFVLFPRDEPTSLSRPVGVSSPTTVRTYALEDLDARMPSVTCVEYDLTYSDPPPDLALVVRCWLQAAISAGALVAWFAFEGSFDFKHVLTPEIADQVYAVATPDGNQLALADEHREGPDWVASLEAVRRHSRL